MGSGGCWYAGRAGSQVESGGRANNHGTGDHARWRMGSNPVSFGSVPKVCPQSRRRRVAQNASATGSGAKRTSSAPCTAKSMSWVSRRADAYSGALRLSFSPAIKRSRPAFRPAAGASSAASASGARGDLAMARSTSRHMMLPEPSQMELSGIWR